MRTEEEIRLKKAYLEGFADAIDEESYSYSKGEKTREKIDILNWVLEDDVKYVTVNDEAEIKNDR